MRFGSEVVCVCCWKGTEIGHVLVVHAQATRMGPCERTLMERTLVRSHPIAIEESPEYEPQCDGLAERCVPIVEGMFKKTRSALESRTGEPVPDDHSMAGHLGKVLAQQASHRARWQDALGACGRKKARGCSSRVRSREHVLDQRLHMVGPSCAHTQEKCIGTGGRLR